MNQKTADWQNAGIGFLALGLIIIGIAIIGWILIALFSEVQQAPTSFLTILVGAFGYILTLLGNYIIQIRKEQIEKKAEIYEKISHFFFDLLFAELLEEPKKTEKDINKFMADCIPKLVMWGSDEVVADFRELRITAFKSKHKSNNGIETILVFEKMLRNIRKDLGHSNNKLNSQGFFIGMFIHNIDEHLILIKNGQSQITNENI